MVQAAGPSRDAPQRHTASGLPRIEGRKGKIVDSQLYSSFPNDAPVLRYLKNGKPRKAAEFHLSSTPLGRGVLGCSPTYSCSLPQVTTLLPSANTSSLAQLSLLYLEWPLPLSCNTSFEMSLSRALPLRSGRGALFRASPSTCRLTQHYALSGRTFSTSAQRDATWGFIGLGQMGRYSQVGEAFNTFQWHCLIDIDNLFVYHRLQHG